MSVKKICVLGVNQTGVPISAVIASKCPEIKVTVVHANPEKIYLWNSKQIPGSAYAPGLCDLIRKCQNKNLFFTTNDEMSIKEADMVFITSDSKLKTSGEGEGEAVDLTLVEDAALGIAEHSESDKIVVENSAVALKAAECIQKVLKSNARPGVSFQVLSNPEFYEEGSSLQNLLFPDRVLIGCEDSSKGLSAAQKLSFVYERWVHPSYIITRDNWTTELSKISSSAFAAQRMVNLQALSIVCEESGGDIAEIIKTLGYDSGIGSNQMELSISLGKFSSIVSNLIYMCDCEELLEAAEYWREVLEMNKFFRERFANRLLWALCQTASNKKVTVMGFAYLKDTTVTRGSASIDLCKRLLEENAAINIYDPRVKKKQILEDLISAGCGATAENLDKVISVFEDPYKALYMSHVMLVCSSRYDFCNLDYPRIFSEMLKPAYIFDSGSVLPHTKLLKIGFKVYSSGKYIKNN